MTVYDVCKMSYRQLAQLLTLYSRPDAKLMRDRIVDHMVRE